LCTAVKSAHCIKNNETVPTSQLKNIPIFSIIALIVHKKTQMQMDLLVEISGSHSGEYEDDCLLGCCAV
jgi:hypothetical protein